MVMFEHSVFSYGLIEGKSWSHRRKGVVSSEEKGENKPEEKYSGKNLWDYPPDSAALREEGKGNAKLQKNIPMAATLRREHYGEWRERYGKVAKFH